MADTKPNTTELWLRTADTLLDDAHRQLKNVDEERISDTVDDLKAINAATKAMDELRKQQRKEYEALLKKIENYSTLLAGIEMALPPEVLGEMENIKRKKKEERMRIEELRQSTPGPT